MPKLEWDTVGERYYETGIDRGVLFVDQLEGVPWNGLISMAESPDGSDEKPFFYDGFNYLNLVTRENFQATLTAYYSPEEFDACDGTAEIASGFYAKQQNRKPFSLSYRTRIGNDTEGDSRGYKIHLIYNALATPASPSYSSVNDQASANSLSWKLLTKPVLIPGAAPSAHFVIDSSKLDPAALQAFETILYGSDVENSRLPTPQEITTILNEFGGLVIIDNGDGSFMAVGQEPYLVVFSEYIYQLNADTVIDNGDGTFVASSLEEG